MATYMYRSASGSNWDDDEDDFNPEVYEAATLANARLVLQHLEVGANNEHESTQSSATIATRPQVDYNIDSNDYPTYAEHMTEFWESDYYRRPAYVELSREIGFTYPDQRRRYNANWMATKLRMGGNMKNTMMMMPSPLRLSQTWTRDSHGGYVEEGGFMSLSLPTPRLSYGNDSDEEREEVYTPPDSPRMVQVSECKAKVEEYGSTTDAVGLPFRNIETMKFEMVRKFASSSGIKKDLDIADILHDVAQDMLHGDINEVACHVLESIKEAKPTVAVTTVTAGATQIISYFAEVSASNAVVSSSQLIQGNNDGKILLADSTYLTTVATHCPSPDVEYIHDPTSTSLVWNPVDAGWFALSSLP